MNLRFILTSILIALPMSIIGYILRVARDGFIYGWECAEEHLMEERRK